MNLVFPPRILAMALAVVLLLACSPASEPVPTGAASAVAAVEPAAVPLDEAELRRAASAALKEQRIYAPVGANAIEHYLALRDIAPDDAALAVALLELLPYAVIGSEQATERGDLSEARRLVALVQRVDPQFPALARLSDRIASTELREAQRVALEAEAEAQRQQQVLLDARREAEAIATAANTTAASATVPEPVAATTNVPPTRSVAPPLAAAPPPAPAVAAAPVVAPTAVPRLLNAPSPRYPSLALRRKLEGEVTVQFTIQPDGSVTEPRVLASSPPGVFDEAALVATRRWQFEASAGSVQSVRVVQFRLAAAQS